MDRLRLAMSPKMAYLLTDQVPESKDTQDTHGRRVQEDTHAVPELTEQSCLEPRNDGRVTKT